MYDNSKEGEFLINKCLHEKNTWMSELMQVHIEHGITACDSSSKKGVISSIVLCSIIINKYSMEILLELLFNILMNVNIIVCFIMCKINYNTKV